MTPDETSGESPWGRTIWLQILGALAVGGLSFLSLTFGGEIEFHVSAVWPTSGLAMAMIFFGGRKFWIAIFVGASLSNAPINIEDTFSIANGGMQSYFIDIATMAGNYGVNPTSFRAGLNGAEIVFGTTESSFFAEVDRMVLTTVPEPSSVALAVSGLVLALAATRRNRRS